MTEFLGEYYLWIKALHVIAVIALMAALLYLPRLFVYHCDVGAGSEASEKFKIMERRLLRYIANPALIATWIFGLLMIWADPSLFQNGWFHVKFTAVILLSGFHGMCAGWMKKFARDANTKSQKFYRYMNEVPTILMIITVIMVIVRPF